MEKTEHAEEFRDIDRLNEQAEALLIDDPEKSEQLAKQAQTMSLESYPEGLAQSLTTLSILNWDRSNYIDALSMALEAARLFEQTGNIRQQAYVLNHIAGIHFLLGNYTQALEVGYTALRLSKQSGDRGLYASILNDNGYICLHVGRSKDAMPQLMESLTIHRETGSPHGEAQVLDSIGKAYLLMGDYAQALRYEQQSLELDRTIGYKRAEVEALGNIGKIYAATQDVQQALEHFFKALELSKTWGYRQLEASLLLDVGRMHLNLGECDLAAAVLQQALEVAAAIQSKPVLFEIYAALAETYEQQGEWQAALHHQKQSQVVKEEVFSEKTAHRLTSLQLIYQVEKAQQEAEISQLKNVELQEQIEAHQRLIAELDAYAYTVAHDLKNPLATVVGYAELLKEDLLGEVYENVPLYLEEVLYNGYKLSSIIDNLLMLASVRQKTIIPDALDMTPIIQETERRLATQIRNRGAQVIKPDRWPLALGYAPWVEEIWANYISNAIKYGGEPPLVELGATQEQDFVRFWVQDNGSGISEADQAKLFTEFTRLSTKEKGYGLGLSIVKRIVEKLGGTIGVESRPGQGSVFSFSLPAAPHDAAGTNDIP